MAKSFRIDKDESRLVECTEKVFSFGDVDPGFPAHRRIDLGDDGGGDLNEGNSAIEDGCDEPCEIADDSSAEGDDEGAPVVAGADHLATEGLGVY